MLSICRHVPAFQPDVTYFPPPPFRRRMKRPRFRRRFAATVYLVTATFRLSRAFLLCHHTRQSEAVY